jgi:hypothetical protein
MEQSATLVVRRTAEHDVKEREIYVSVDGSPNEILRFGDTVRIPVAPGRHRLRAHNTWSRRYAEFDAHPGEEIRFSTANVPGRGYMFSAVFFGFALMNTELHREDSAAATTQDTGERGDSHRSVRRRVPMPRTPTPPSN